MDEFRRMIDADEFAEWAEVHGNCYGTSIRTLEENRAAGVDLILISISRGHASSRSGMRAAFISSFSPPASRNCVGGSTGAPRTATR